MSRFTQPLAVVGEAVADVDEVRERRDALITRLLVVEGGSELDLERVAGER